MSRGYLVLEDGTVLEGESFGYRDSVFGEVVFSTGMDGYQESLTDPSFQGQILIMTYPIVGNYGINDEFDQSEAVHTKALVVREYCKEPSTMYGGRTLDHYLKENRIPGLSGIDTRDLVIKIRDQGAMKGAITDDKDSIEDVLAEVRKMPSAMDSNLVGQVSTRSVRRIERSKTVPTVGLLDCGTKSGITRDLASRFNVVIFPYDTPAQEIVDSNVDGLLISNGPGNPSHPAILSTVVKSVDYLAGKMPMYGICFGSQTMALGLGGKTYKMKFGHRGCNQPVKYEGRVYITSQNHGYAVDESSLDGLDIIVDQVNVNDGTVEGIRHRDLPIFTTQYHPEASPGPLDTSFLFDKFGKMMEAQR
jgi:carbamoyl-phosphate synthase small subunit